MGSLLLAGVLVPQAGDIRGLRVAGVNDHAIAIAQPRAGLHGRAPVLGLVVGECRKPERVRREQAVSANVPAHRVTRGPGVVENRDPHLLAVDVPGIIAPVRGLAPRLFFGREAVGVHDVAGSFVLLQHGPDTDSEYAVLAIAERHLLDRGERDIEVDGSQRRVAVERHDAVLAQKRYALEVAPFEPRGDGPGVLPALHGAELFQNDLAPVRRGVGSLVVPEVQTVYAIVGEPKPPLMLMVLLLLLLFGDVLHTPYPRDVRAGGGAQRVKVRLGDVGSRNAELGEGLAVDLDDDLLRPRSNLDLPAGRKHGQGGQTENESHWMGVHRISQPS